MNNIPKEIITDNYKYELYIPTVIRPYKIWFQNMYLKRYVRLMIQALRGSYIFYMKDLSDKVIGYIHLEKENARYPWTTSNDWVISPYAIDEKLRGGWEIRLLKSLKIKF